MSRQTLRRLRICAVVCCFLLAVSSGRAAATPDVQTAFGKTGLSGLTWEGTELLESGTVRVDKALLETWNGTVTEGETTPISVNVDAAHKATTQIYQWGRMQCAYTAKGNILTLTVTLVNSSALVLKGVSLQLGTLRVPVADSEPGGKMSASVDAPGIVTAQWAGGTLALCNETTGRPLYLGLLRSPQGKNGSVLQMATFREDRFPRGWLTTPQIQRPIYPGASDMFTLSLRFGSSNASASSLAADVLQKFGQAYPFCLKWADRRPIGTLHLATSEYRLPKNPRGWFNGDKTVDITTEAGQADFQQRLMRYADESIAQLKAMNAQGMIVWDIEGEEFPHATTYVGDPRSLPAEIEPLADAFFKKFIAAGLRVGLCLRPQQPVRRLYGADAWQMQSDDPDWLLEEKIKYAQKRWGCTLFYVDSNVTYDPRFKPNDGAGYELLPATLFQNVAARHLDILLMPEQKAVRYYASTAPYGELRGGNTGTPAAVRAVYPQSFSVIYVPDGSVEQHREALVAAVKQGDILLFRAWFPDEYNAKIKAIYQDAKH